MEDEERTREQLVEELARLRARVTGLEDSERDRQQMEQALRESEERYRSLVDLLPEALVIHRKGRFVYLNEAATGLFGAENQQELVGKPVLDMVHPDFLEAVKERIRRGQKLRKRQGLIEIRAIRLDGQVIDVEARSAPITYRGKQATLAIVTDVTDRNKAEEMVSHLASIVESSDDAIVGQTLDNVIISWNRGAENIYGFTSDEIIGRSLDTLIPEDRAHTMNELIDKIRRGGEVVQFETVDRRKNGERFNVSLTISPVRDKAGNLTAVSWVARDITQRKRVEEALRESEEKYRTIFNNASFAIFQVTPDGRYITANSALADMLGYDSPEELMTSVSDIGHQVYVEPSRRNQLRSLLRAKGAVTGFEAQLQRKDGSTMWSWGDVRTIRGPGGETLYHEGMMTDITDRKLLQEELLQAQKMEAVGQLAGGVAHDLNNMLTPILGFSETATTKLSPGHPAHVDLHEVQEAAKRAATLTRPLLAFSRRQIAEPIVVNLDHLVLSTAKMLGRTIGENIELVCRTGADMPMVKVDRGQIEQVLINMAINARDAMPDGGTLTIETANVNLTPDSASKPADLKPGPYVRLSITDTGTGMDDETKSHIFEPFFTTKEPGKGTGLGLATCYGIVKQSQGDIRLQSEPGQGTTFEIYLPRVEDESIPAVEREEPKALPTGTETILLVEDEPSVRRLLARLLGRQGYTVLEAADGIEALRVVDEHGGEGIHLLLTDVVMPRLGGKGLADRLRARFPTMKVLFTSGYLDESLQQWTSQGGTSFLAKPFTSSVVAREVRGVLDGIAPA